MSNESSDNLDRWLLARFPRRAVIMGYALVYGMVLTLAVGLVLSVAYVLVVVGYGTYLFVAGMIAEGYFILVAVGGGIIAGLLLSLFMHKEIDRDVPEREKKPDEPDNQAREAV